MSSRGVDRGGGASGPIEGDPVAGTPPKRPFPRELEMVAVRPSSRKRLQSGTPSSPRRRNQRSMTGVMRAKHLHDRRLRSPRRDVRAGRSEISNLGGEGDSPSVLNEESRPISSSPSTTIGGRRLPRTRRSSVADATAPMRLPRYRGDEPPAPPRPSTSARMATATVELFVRRGTSASEIRGQLETTVPLTPRGIGPAGVADDGRRAELATRRDERAVRTVDATALSLSATASNIEDPRAPARRPGRRRARASRDA